MDEQTELEDQLTELQRRWQSLTSPPPQPRSVMNVVEYGLGENKRAEVYINRLLRYLLASEEPHGMGTDFLRAFIEGLPPDCGFEEDLYDLSDVVVGEQVSVSAEGDDGRESKGWLDLLIQVPEEWFLLVELKFSAPETGTEFYCRADKVDERPKSEYESGEYYLYIHQSDEPEATGPCFTNWSWSEFLDDVVVPFLLDQGSRYPQRTVNQFRDLTYDIKEITGMSEHERSEREKSELFVEYYDAVSDVSEAFENRWDQFTDDWTNRLADRIDDTEILGDWVFWEHSDDWAFIYKNGWWRRVDTFDPVMEPVDPNRVRVGFLHRLEQNRELALGEHTLKFYFRNTPPNRHEQRGETNFRDLFIENFDARKEQIRSELPDKATLTGNMHNMIEATYDIPVNDADEFESAYIAALHTAFEDHVIDNPELVDLLDSAYTETLDVFK